MPLSCLSPAVCREVNQREALRLSLSHRGELGLFFVITAGIAGALTAGIWLIPEVPLQWSAVFIAASSGSGMLLAGLAMRTWNGRGREGWDNSISLQIDKTLCASLGAADISEDDWCRAHPSRQKRGTSP